MFPTPSSTGYSAKVGASCPGMGDVGRAMQLD
jgi:hypothetical protein